MAPGLCVARVHGGRGAFLCEIMQTPRKGAAFAGFFRGGRSFRPPGTETGRYKDTRRPGATKTHGDWALQRHTGTGRYKGTRGLGATKTHGDWALQRHTGTGRCKGTRGLGAAKAHGDRALHRHTGTGRYKGTRGPGATKAHGDRALQRHTGTGRCLQRQRNDGVGNPGVERGRKSLEESKCGGCRCGASGGLTLRAFFW